MTREARLDAGTCHVPPPPHALQPMDLSHFPFDSWDLLVSSAGWEISQPAQPSYS